MIYKSSVDRLGDGFEHIRGVAGKFVYVQGPVVWLPIWLKKVSLQVQCDVKKIDLREVGRLDRDFQAVFLE